AASAADGAKEGAVRPHHHLRARLSGRRTASPRHSGQYDWLAPLKRSSNLPVNLTLHAPIVALSTTLRNSPDRILAKTSSELGTRNSKESPLATHKQGGTKSRAAAPSAEPGLEAYGG